MSYERFETDTDIQWLFKSNLITYLSFNIPQTPKSDR